MLKRDCKPGDKVRINVKECQTLGINYKDYFLPGKIYPVFKGDDGRPTIRAEHGYVIWCMVKEGYWPWKVLELVEDKPNNSIEEMKWLAGNR